MDGRLFIAEPPLYRVDDKKNPFVINKEDYINRYVKAASKDYKLGYEKGEGNGYEILFLTKEQWADFLSATSNYVDTIHSLMEHYKVNDRLIEMILEEFANRKFPETMSIQDRISSINIQILMNRIGIEFPEIYYDDKNDVIRGVIDGKYQLIEISEQFIRKATPMIDIIKEWGSGNGSMVLKDLKTGTEHRLSMLGILKILKKYQPNIVHRFKGLGENDDEDIKETIMNPDTRSLIQVYIGDIENDMKVFQTLRGGTSIDLLNRKTMMKNFQVDPAMIDT